MGVIAEQLNVQNRFVCLGGVNPVINHEDYGRELRALEWVKADSKCLREDNPERHKLSKRNWKNVATVLDKYDEIASYYGSVRRQQHTYPYLARVAMDVSEMIRVRDPLFERLCVRIAPERLIPMLRPWSEHHQLEESAYLQAA